jgi:hypothetical protein
MDLYSLTATLRDVADSEVAGVMILQDGKLLDGDFYVYYTGKLRVFRWKVAR